MSRKGLTWPCLTRSVWDRPATDTRLLPTPLSQYRVPRPFSDPQWDVIQDQRPLSTTAVRRHIGEATTLAPPPDRGCPRFTAEVSRAAPFRGAVTDACPDSPQMFPRLPLASLSLRRGCLTRLAADVNPQLTPLRASPSAVDARAFARMNSRSAVPGVEAGAWAFAQAISHAPAPDAPAHAAEGALAHPLNISNLP